LKKGIRDSVIYYSIGLGLAGLSYLIDGNYGHGPGLHHIIIFLTFLGGALWALRSTMRHFLYHRSERQKGSALFNLFMSLLFALLFYITAFVLEI
jgi:hypothetical protein